MRLEITIPFNRPLDASTTYLMAEGASLRTLDATQQMIPMTDPYTSQGEAFPRQMRDEQATTGTLHDAIINVSIVGAVFRGAASGRFEEV